MLDLLRLQLLLNLMLSLDLSPDLCLLVLDSSMLCLELLLNLMFLAGLVIQLLLQLLSLFLGNLYLIFQFHSQLGFGLRLFLGQYFSFLAGLLVLVSHRLGFDPSNLLCVSSGMGGRLQSLLLGSLVLGLLPRLLLRCSLLQGLILGLGLHECFILFLKLLNSRLFSLRLSLNPLSCRLERLCLGLHPHLGLLLDLESHVGELLLPRLLPLLDFLLHFDLGFGLRLGLHSVTLLLFSAQFGLVGGLGACGFHRLLSFLFDGGLLLTQDFIDDVTIAIRRVGRVSLLIENGLVSQKVVPIV